MRRHASLVALALVVIGCGGPVLANPAAVHPVVTPAPSATPRPADPLPVMLPADDAAHDRLTEWWYDTGHLRAADGRRFGFEYVVFRAERGGFPVAWASHLALTDETGETFSYAQRSEIGPQVDLLSRSAGPAAGFSFALGAAAPSPWTMTGGGGHDVLRATATGDEVHGDATTAIGIDLDLTARKAPILHDGDGWIDFGPAGGSYYVSRTDMAATGTVTVGGETLAVEGDAWFDHQWGDFISVGGGGWDWFAVNLDDGTDLMLSLVRDADGTYPLVYGTLVDADGHATNLGADAFAVDVTDHWTSPTTGAVYPAGWRIRMPAHGLDIALHPTVAQQELDTRATTGVVYWEGSQVVSAIRDGRPLGGQAYVELTGYSAGGPAPQAPAP
jgi:predicted secreted hydrolase